MSEKGSKLGACNETVVKFSHLECNCTASQKITLQFDLDCCKGLSLKEQIFIFKPILASGLLLFLAYLRCIYKANLQINKSFL